MYETSFGETALQYHALAVLSMMIAPISYSMDFPQCVYPGKFDKFGKCFISYQTMYVV